MSAHAHQEQRSREEQPGRAVRPTASAHPRSQNLKHIFMRTFEAVPHAVALFDEDGRLVTANRRFRTLLALDDDSNTQFTTLQEHAWLFRVRDAHGHPLPANRLPAARALRGERLLGSTAVNLCMQALDGRELHVRASAAPLHNGVGQLTGCIAFLYDMNGMWHSVAQLREAASRAQNQQAILDAISDGVLVFDQNEHFLHLNEAARTLLHLGNRTMLDEMSQVKAQLKEYMQDDVVGQTLPHEEWPLSRVLRREAAGKTADGPEVADLVHRLPDGGEQLLNVSAAPIYKHQRLAGAVLTLRDVTDQRQLERKFAGIGSHIDSILDGLPDGLVFYNLDGRITRINAAARLLLGCSNQDGHGTIPLTEEDAHVRFLDMRGQPMPLELRPVTRILRGETLTSERALDVRVQRSDGSELVLSMSGAPVRDEEGHVIGAVVTMRDTTEAHRLDAGRVHMIRAVSHELKSPLAAISMASELIGKRVALGMTPSADALSVLSEGVVRMEQFVNDLLDMARIEAGQLTLKPVPFDLRALCRHVGQEQMRESQRTIVFDLTTRAAHVKGDPMRISQVVTILLSNALQYSAPDTSVTLRLRRKAGSVLVEVCDEGPGIPPEAQVRLFERYYRVPDIKVQQGSSVSLGMGLFVARTLVELHGGSIGVEGEVGRGSTFWFKLPGLRHAAGER